MPKKLKQIYKFKLKVDKFSNIFFCQHKLQKAKIMPKYDAHAK